MCVDSTKRHQIESEDVFFLKSCFNVVVFGQAMRNLGKKVLENMRLVKCNRFFGGHFLWI